MSSKDVVEDFCSSLCDLTVNSKPHINMLTMLAEDYIEHAPALVQAVEDQLKHVSGEVKLPVLYLIDSIVKNVGQSYTTLFSKNIANTFTHAFEKVDEKARSQMYKLRQTWVSVFPAGKLYMLDTKVNAIDPAWPITAAPTTSSIHLNPKFLSSPATLPPVPSIPGDKNQELLKQKKELLELQKRKVELELMQTKAKLEEQTRRVGTVPTVTTPPVPVPKEVKKIPPATNIIASKPKLPPVEAPKTKSPSVAALVAPVRIRDPRLRFKESSKDSPSDSPEVATPPRVVLSPVPSPSNSQSGSSTEPSSKSPKKDRKSKKNKEKSRKSDDGGSSSKSKDKVEKPAKLTRAEEVLRNLEEEQRLSKMQKLGSDTVINKAKQHEQMSHPKAKESKAASPSPVVKPVEPKVVEAPPRERTPEAPPPPPIISTNRSPSPKLDETITTTPPRLVPDTSPPRSLPLPPLIDSPTVSTSSSKENFSTPDESPQKRKGSRPPSKTPSPPQIRKLRDPKSTKRKRQKSLSPPKDSPKRKTPTRQPSPSREKSEPVNPSIPEAETLLDSGHDTDLRLLTAKSIELETSSPSKKAKTDMHDLFGTEDVDLRALPPPPPIISRITPPSSPLRDSPMHRSLSRSPERQKSWANLKRSNSDTTSPDVSKKPYRTPNERRKSDRFINNKDKEGADEEELSYDDPAYEERAKERAEMIMKHAEEQLSNGNITFAQYNSLLKEVITMNEKRKLQEAIRLDTEKFDYDNGKSPSPEPQEPEIEPSNVFNKRRKVLDDNLSPISDLEGSRDNTPPPPPPPEISERDFMPRQDPRLRDDDRRYGMDGRNRGVPRFEHGRMSLKGPWMGNQPPMPPRGAMRPRDKFGRWPPMVGPGRPPFDGGKPVRYGPPIMNSFGGGPSSVPPADPAVLAMIAKDPMKTINIDGVPREIRFYGETAIIMMAWDDPRELNFQPGTSRVTFNDRESFIMSFNAPYQDVYVDGMYAKVRLGAPTRELFVDGVHYEGIFNGPPIQVRVGNRLHSVRLQGKLPNVKIGTEQRKDLVAGKVTLIVDANDIFPIYLDAKPQRFDIGGAPYILRFVEALQTVVINGVPFKIEFGSNLPVPMFFHGVKHYLRFSNLPPGIKPGYVKIINMEGGRLPTPPPLLPPPPLMADPSLMPPAHTSDVIMAEQPEQVSEPVQEPAEPAPRPQPEQPLELLASLMPTVFTPGIGQGYTVEENSNHPPESLVPTSTASSTTTTMSDLSSINVGELLKKLVAVGIVPASDKKEEKKEEVITEIIPVSFERPDSLKTRQPGLVHLLYSGMQCSSCGVRFPPEQTGKYSQHLDWHFRQNRRERDAMRVAQSRRWNYDVSDWIQYQEIEEKEDRAQSWFEIQEKRNFEVEEATEEEQSVAAGEKGENACCEICQDKFDQFYNEEKEEWHLRKAIEVDGELYHPICHKDREEKLQNSVVETTQLTKSVLMVPTEEPELIEIPDDSVSNEPVLCMPIDQEKVETIDLDSEQSNSKDGQEDKKEEEDGGESDDDILGIEDVEPQIETVDLSEELDKSDEPRQEEEKGEGEPDENEEVGTEEDNVEEVDLSKVKSEKVEVVDLDAQTSQPLVVSSIDGNVELEDAAPVSLPRRIVINIPSAVTKPKAPEEPPQEEEAVPPKSPPVQPPVIDACEPPPPGEELYPLSVKPRLSEVDLKILQPVNKGNELSALCSIM